MGRLIDIDSLRGCVIIRPTSHEIIEHIKQCMDDALSHDDIPTAYDVERVVEELENEKERAEKDRSYWKEHEWKDAHYFNNADLADTQAEDMEKAIDIVKRGGVE